jgi:hypothetical protein
VGLGSLVVVWLPLRLLRRRRRPRGLVRYGLYFTCIGLGFMAVEMALLQRFGLLLGHPSYALSVVLASLLFGSGVGSLYSSAILARLGGPRFTAYALCALMLGLVPRAAAGRAQTQPLRCGPRRAADRGGGRQTFFPVFQAPEGPSPPTSPGLSSTESPVLAPILNIIAITFGTFWSRCPHLLAGVLLPAERRAA